MYDDKIILNEKYISVIPTLNEDCYYKDTPHFIKWNINNLRMKGNCYYGPQPLASDIIDINNHDEYKYALCKYCSENLTRLNMFVYQFYM